MLQAAEAGSTNILSMIWPFVLMFAVFYFLLIRPQQKKQKQRTSMLGQLKKGDKISTVGGLHGTVVELSDDTVVLRVNDTTKMTFERSAINNIINSAPAVVDLEK
ncbi:preprotein translocase subunit YajC [Paenibacillus sp. FSL H8-0548]|uniref:preprotein translocase subunit YajC n=1 Tax=Paenibacillus sp. FSL H8-0548 TaxID=1920422 RepID=UPI00096CD519|nr:preprotein translocase subunit YajC [Paenibacillus sp. FSL H8-0548]OMF31693.1 preprotein translocase subunit YajC [Paenibacillus sp. FSL H8-0548]